MNKLFLTLCLALVAGQVFSQSWQRYQPLLYSVQQNTLHDIANQCPLLHGKAVYNARSLYALIENVIYEDNCPTQPQAKSTEVCHHKDVSFVNPSLEGILGHFLTPPQGWVVCEQSVDFMPISLNSTEFAMASDGQMYTHLFSTYPAPEAYRESVGQELGGTLQSNELYMFSVDLSYNFKAGADTGILSISLGDSLCHRGQVIYHQEVDDFAWTPHVIEFVPNKDYKYIIFSSEVDSSKYTGGNMIIGNVIMDNLQNVRCGVNATGTEAVEEADDNYFLLYPNPNATGQLTVEWASPSLNPSANGEGLAIVVVDALGREVGNYAVPTGITAQQIDIAQLASGYYTVLLQYQNRAIARAKLVVAK